METPDDHIIRRIRSGDNSSFALLVERYNLKVYNLMYRYSGSVEEAADMTQDVFCKVFEKLDRYQAGKSFFSWLYTLALNHARDWSRKRQKRQHKLSSFIAEPEMRVASPGENCESKQDAEHLMRALNSLPDNRREMVILRYRHDHSIRELADIFQLSESAVKMRLQRSLADLGRKLQGS